MANHYGLISRFTILLPFVRVQRRLQYSLRLVLVYPKTYLEEKVSLLGLLRRQERSPHLTETPLYECLVLSDADYIATCI